MSGFELIPKTDFEDIAAAIRSKTGKSALLKSGEMADEIESIEGGVAPAIPKNFTLTAENWNGTTYTLITEDADYGTSGGEIPYLLISPGADSAASNYDNVVNAGLTLPAYVVEEGLTGLKVTITISAIYTPLVDVGVAIWGLLYDEQS